jgi:hypothetical protein
VSRVGGTSAFQGGIRVRIDSVASVEEIRSQLRFFLNELGVRNEHHTFERLCREFSRHRICKNVVPATGPVSAGGDQGRDFETFRSYLQNCGLEANGFIGESSGALLAFACSVQRDNLRQKILADLEKISKGGHRPERVYFFLTSDLTAADRHKTQDEGRERFGLDLDIIDRQALSEHLSELDLFWIAIEYLKIPSELYPPLPADPKREKYERNKQKWMTREPDAVSFSQFEKLRRALRQSSRNSSLRGDVDFFCSKVRLFRTSPIEWLRARAIYEEVVSQIYAFNSLRGFEQDIRDYFATYTSIDYGTLRDGVTLLFFVYGAQQRDVVGIDLAEIQSWHAAWVNLIDTALPSPTMSGSDRCALLDQRGVLSLFITDHSALRRSADEAVGYWLRLLTEATKSPLYPLEPVSDYVNQMLPLLEGASGLHEFLEKLDAEIAKRSGSRSVAKASYERAQAWAKAKQPIQAIRHLHRAKVDWLSAESIGLSIISILQIARWYNELRLSYAAKYYSLAASFMSSRPDEPAVIRLMPGGLLLAADSEFAAGAWAGYLVWATAALPMLAALGPADQKAQEEEINRLAFHAFTILHCCDLLSVPDVPAAARRFLEAVGMDGIEDQVLPNAREQWPTAEALWKATPEELSDQPLGDVGPERTIRWSALGLEWSFRFKNDYSTSIVAEELVALFQILVADLADVELHLLPTKISAGIDVISAGQVNARRIPSNHASVWKIEIPNDSDLDTRNPWLMAVFFQILQEVSVAPSKVLSSVLENLFKEGLPAKVFVARPYRELVEHFIGEENFNGIPRLWTGPQGLEPFSVRGADELAWRSLEGPEYSADDAREAIRLRYRRSIVPTAMTVARLRQVPSFTATVAVLRNDGWKDWHILMAIAGLIVNERLPKNVAMMSRKEASQLYWDAMERPEQEDDQRLPDELFSLENLRRQIAANMTSSAKNLGLELHQATPDLEALERFLSERYHYKSDDIAHDNLF